MVSRIAHLKLMVNEENTTQCYLYSTIETIIFGKDQVSVFEENIETVNKNVAIHSYSFYPYPNWIWISCL